MHKFYTADVSNLGSNECPGRRLLNLANCIAWAHNTDGVSWMKSQFWTSFPQGCFVLHDSVFFNTAEFGNPHPRATPICWSGT